MHTALATTRASAEKWAAYIGTILTVGGLAALIGGTDEVGSLSNDTIQVVVLGALLGSGAAGATAMLLASMAAHPTPTWIEIGTASEFKRWSDERNETAGGLMKWSRGLAIAAVVLLLGGAVAAWWDRIYATPDPPEKHILFIGANGVLRCEPLATSLGEPVVIDGMPLDSETTVSLVETCPE